MKTKNILQTLTAALLAALLAACGGDEQTATFNWKTAELAYSYPYQGQQEVPLAAPVVLHFSEPVQFAEDDDLLEELTLWQVVGEEETEIALVLEARHDENEQHPVSVVLRPENGKLAPATNHRLELGTISSELSEVGVPPEGVSFRTRGEPDSARSRMGDDAFFVSRILPDGNEFQVLDFSTLRVQFSQPVERDSLRYGETLSLLDKNDALVEARAYLKGHYLTIAPNEELEPGREYRLVQEGEGLRSVGGDTLVINGDQLAGFTPRDTRPRATMVQEARSSEDDDTLVSRLTGALINAVPVTAVLLGEPEDNTSFQSGDVFAELAHVPTFPDATPLRVPRGNLLKGSSLEVKVAGEVPAGFESGDISVDFINDAVGYMIPNDFNRNRANKNMPRHVRLIMDIAMTAENPEANAALSQDLLHVELAGIAKVRDGRMEIDAVGVVEPEVLGLETASGLLSFNMKAHEDQKNTPPFILDETAPELQSWTMVPEHQDKARPGDPIILNFTRPLDPASLEQDGAVTLWRNGTALSGEDLRMRVDGASLIVEPREGLRHNVDYELEFSEDMKGANGVPVIIPEEFLPQLSDFSLPDHPDDVSQRSPIVTTLYPGFPCPTTGASLGGSNEHHGRCIGGASGDDLLPVTSLPRNRPISVHFSRDMDPDSIRMNESFRVEHFDGAWEPVDGWLQVRARKMTFHPDKPWKEGELYRYVLGSNGDRFSSVADCGGSAMCSTDGLPLQTRVLAQSAGAAPDPQGGGPDMVINFRGASVTEAVFQEARNLPTFDVNADFILQDEERKPLEEDPDNPGSFLPPSNSTELGITSTSGLLLSAQVGCPPGESCPEDKFIHLTGGLTVDVIGFEEEPDVQGCDLPDGGVRVEINPTQIMTTSIDTHANLLLLGSEVIPTGPQIMRLRYARNDQGQRTEPVVGHIRQGDDGPVFCTELDIYLDAPWLEPKALGISLSHNLHSFPLDGVVLEGPVTFIEDGRMLIEQRNRDAVIANVSISLLGIGAAGMRLEIPPSGIHILYSSMPAKD